MKILNKLFTLFSFIGFYITGNSQLKAAEAAGSLLSYEGEEFYEGDDMAYVGLEDDSLHFEGSARSFLNESSNNVRFAYKVQNLTASTKVIALTPAYFSTAAEVASATGETCDGILTDGVILSDGGADVVGTALDAKHKISPMLDYIKRNPTRITEIILQSNTDASFEERMTIREASPFRSLGNNYLNLTDYLDPDQFNNKKVVIPIAAEYDNFQMDDQKVLLLPIGGTNVVATTGVILNVTYKIGAIHNPAAKLAKRAKRASHTIDAMRAKGLLK